MAVTASFLPTSTGQAVADPAVTTVVYMPAKTLPELVAKAVGAGLDPATPAVAVERATRPDERVIAAADRRVPARLAAEPPSGPVIVMIGRALAEYVEAAAHQSRRLPLCPPSDGCDTSRHPQRIEDAARHARPSRRTSPHSFDARRTPPRFPGTSRRSRSRGPRRAHRYADQQRHRAASAGALAIRRRRAGRQAPRLCLHQRHRRQGPQIRHPGGGRRAVSVAGHLCHRHGPQGR